MGLDPRVRNPLTVTELTVGRQALHMDSDVALLARIVGTGLLHHAVLKWHLPDRRLVEHQLYKLILFVRKQIRPAANNGLRYDANVPSWLD